MADVKVKLLKDHNGQKKGTTGNVAKGRAEYLVRVGVAEYVDVKPTETKPKTAKTTKTSKPKLVKKVEEKEPCKTC